MKKFVMFLLLFNFLNYFFKYKLFIEENNKLYNKPGIKNIVIKKIKRKRIELHIT